jgi:hypothetical protein
VRQLPSKVLNAVENDLTSIPYNAATAVSDGRMYPPDPQFEQAFPWHPKVRCFAHVSHFTLIGHNGAIEIRGKPQRPVSGVVNPLDGELIFSKAGSDGKKVMEQ